MFKLFFLFILISISNCSSLKSLSYPPLDFTNKRAQSDDILRKILLSKVPQFRKCYQKDQISRKGEIYTQKILLNFTILHSGKIAEEIEINQFYGEKIKDQFKDCVSQKLKNTIFPKVLNKEGIKIKQPIQFFPKRSSKLPQD